MRVGLITSVFVGAILTIAARGQEPMFHAGIDVVRVDVSVTEHGEPVRGLTADNFAITDAGVAEPITGVTLEQLPLRVVLVLDTSDSVRGSALAALVDASRGLVGALGASDRLAVLTFSGEPTLVSGFDAGRDAVLTALSRVRPGGTTALYDTLQVALELVHLDDETSAARPLVVVCTDGLDSGSWLSGEDLVESARRADVVVHVIDSPRSPTYGLVDMDTIAKVSGGRTWSAASEADLKGLFTQTLVEMRNRYLLTFAPARPVHVGWHDLKVTLKNVRGDVVARPGYYVVKGG